MPQPGRRASLLAQSETGHYLPAVVLESALKRMQDVHRLEIYSMIPIQLDPSSTRTRTSLSRMPLQLRAVT